MCLQIFEANNKSSISSAVGTAVVTIFKWSLESVTLSLSCTKTPFKQVRTVVCGNSTSFWIKIILFFFSSKISIASWSYDGAITTSQNNWLISFAVATSIFPFAIKTPPKAEVGSPAKASKYASFMVFLVAKPQALLCFKIAKVGLSFLNSFIKFTAASTSNKLLYDNSFP